MDKFGRASSSSSRNNVTPIVYKTFNLDKNGHYNFYNKRLCNVLTPEEDTDCANKKYVADTCQTLVDLLSNEMHLIAESNIDVTVKRIIEILKKELYIDKLTAPIV